MEHKSLEIVTILTVGFGLAGILAYIARRLKLPTILGYLLAGYIIGPFSPGYVANLEIAEQLAEIGVVLMLFGVGLHFKLEDLISVQKIAIPGATIQTLLATVATALIIYFLGGTVESGIILGLAIGVASTVVLIRVLTDHHLLNTKEGHIAVGWLVIEDIFTVIILILLPLFATLSTQEELSIQLLVWTIGLVLVKFIVLALCMFTWGHKVVNYILINVVRLRSQELFTLTVIALLFIIAAGSTALFGTSIALGAFIAGMVIGKTSVKHQATANALPLKDLFAVIFFLSVGMLFNPNAIVEHFLLFSGILFVVIAVKPLSAFFITLFFKQSYKTSLTVALALAQIGEFSFILAEEAMNLKLIPEEGFDILVAVALVSISINPLLFQYLDFFESFLRKCKYLVSPSVAPIKIKTEGTNQIKVIIVGYGPIGKKIAHIAHKNGYTPIIIENNIDTVSDIENPFSILFGNAVDSTILEEAHLREARYLFITIPAMEATMGIIDTARQTNPKIQIIARIAYISEEQTMDALKVRHICSEKEALEEFKVLTQELLIPT